MTIRVCKKHFSILKEYGKGTPLRDIAKKYNDNPIEISLFLREFIKKLTKENFISE